MSKRLSDARIDAIVADGKRNPENGPEDYCPDDVDRMAREIQARRKMDCDRAKFNGVSKGTPDHPGWWWATYHGETRPVRVYMKYGEPCVDYSGSTPIRFLGTGPDMGDPWVWGDYIPSPSETGATQEEGSRDA